MNYRVLLPFFILCVSCHFATAQSPYAAKQGDAVYWAVTSNMDSASLLTLSKTLKLYRIGFNPSVERDKKGFITQLKGTVIPFSSKRIPPDTLLRSGLIRLEEQPLWPGFANIDVGNTPIPDPPVVLPLGFKYSPQSGIRTDIDIQQLPASIRAQVEKEFPAPVVEQMLQANRQKLRLFRESVAPGKPAFDFTLADTAGRAVRLSDYKGKVIYLDFWAHWCQPCMADMEIIKQNYGRFNRPDLVFLSVSVDQPTDRQKWLNTLRKRQFVGKHVLGEGGWKGKTARLYGIREIPTSFIIGRDGAFFATKLTPLSFGGLEPVIELLEAALAKQP